MGGVRCKLAFKGNCADALLGVNNRVVRAASFACFEDASASGATRKGT